MSYETIAICDICIADSRVIPATIAYEGSECTLHACQRHEREIRGYTKDGKPAIRILEKFDTPGDYQK